MANFRVTATLMALNIITYLVLAYNSRSFLEIDHFWMLKYGLNMQDFLDGAHFQIVTNLFLHFDLSHLGYNMIFLFFFGSKCEEIYGEKRFLGLYMFCGIVSSLSAFAYPLNSISAGSSGAIYGILGATLIAQRNLYPSGMITSFIYGMIFFLLAAATGFLAHLIGLIIGFGTGFMITRNWYPDEEKADEKSLDHWDFDYRFGND